jgi:hypothetical protein
MTDNLLVIPLLLLSNSLSGSGTHRQGCHEELGPKMHHSIPHASVENRLHLAFRRTTFVAFHVSILSVERQKRSISKLVGG